VLGGIERRHCGLRELVDEADQSRARGEPERVE
jgi:hypothetical protein